MGVVRREGDWRLEKRDEGFYVISYQKEPQLKVYTPDYTESGLIGSDIGAVPVRDVGSYSEAEGLFEELAHGDPPTGTGIGNPGTQSPTGGDMDAWDTGADIGAESETELYDIDMPPGGIALVFLLAGGFILYTSGFAPQSMLFLIGSAFTLGGLAVLSWGGVIYRKDGLADATEFLLTVDDQSQTDTQESDVEKTPPLSESKKHQLIFDRADHQCEWCEDRFDHPHVHHIKPRSEGGPNDPSNLIVLSQTATIKPTAARFHGQNSRPR